MSKPTRKTLLNVKPDVVIGSRRRESLIKASGDSPNNHQRSRTKNNIPKSVRNDLENTLVGLCDVWFEEIKPHLIRNNVKLHLHTPAGRQGQQPGVEECPHIDTGAAPTGSLVRVMILEQIAESLHSLQTATASSCELCRLLFNAASGIDSAMSQAAMFTSIPGERDTDDVTSGYQKTQDVGVQTCIDKGLLAASVDDEQCPHTKILKMVQGVYAAISKVEESESIRRQYKQKSLWSSDGFESKNSRSLSLLSPKDPFPFLNFSQKNQRSSSQNHGEYDILETKKNPKYKRNVPQLTPIQKTSIPTNYSIIQRRTATTTIPKNNPEPRDKSRQKHQEGKKLIYPEDLIEKFGEKHGKRIAVLYRSPKCDTPSEIALTESSSTKGQNKNSCSSKPKKKPPWR